jgi:hypothetical protein
MLLAEGVVLVLAALMGRAAPVGQGFLMLPLALRVIQMVVVEVVVAGALLELMQPHLGRLLEEITLVV